MNFDLKSALLPRRHFRAVFEAQIGEPFTERQNVLSKRAPQVRGVTPGVEPAKFAVHLAFRVANSCPVGDQQRSIHCDYRAAVSGHCLDPTENLISIL